MKVLSATFEKQGERSNDFCYCKEGELVYFGTICDGESIDGDCGCKRSMSGMESLKATTTVKVIDMHLTKQDYLKRFIKVQIKAGFYDKKHIAFYKKSVKTLLDTANHFPLGAVIEIRGDIMRIRWNKK